MPKKCTNVIIPSLVVRKKICASGQNQVKYDIRNINIHSLSRNFKINSKFNVAKKKIMDIFLSPACVRYVTSIMNYEGSKKVKYGHIK